MKAILTEIVIFSTLLCIVNTRPLTFKRKYCTPGQQCWPNRADIDEFIGQLTGHVIQRHDSEYTKLLYMVNTFLKRYPAIIVQVQTTGDVQKSIAFTRRHNIRLTIYSCGHDYASGRSTANDSLQINLSQMNYVKVKLDDRRSRTGSSVWAQSGAKWLQVYEKVAALNKQAVGGGCTSVCVAGFTMGGGVSIISRHRGLAVDNVIEFDIVLFNGTLLTCSSKGTVRRNSKGQIMRTTDNDLFWAVRGGGGGTFGVVLSFTFTIHDAPSSVSVYDIMYPIVVNGDNAIGKQVLSFVFDYLPSLPNVWSSYIMTHASDNIAIVHLIMVLNGPGDSSTASALEKIRNFNADIRLKFTAQTYRHVHDYLVTMNFSGEFRQIAVSANAKLSGSDENLIDFFTTDAVVPRVMDASSGCAVTLVGGKVSEIPSSSSAVSAGFRQGDVTLSCDVAWSDENLDEIMEADGAYLDCRLSALAKTSYLNEASSPTGSWKDRHWGENYDRLLDIKHKYDPLNVFTCHHCVGSDE